MRDITTAITKTAIILMALAVWSAATAQEPSGSAAVAPSVSESASPTPATSEPPVQATPDVSASPTVTPTATASPSQSITARNIRISFLPPPLEGTISLGIYDPAGKLVRILHREAQVEEFTIGPDALVTAWDGKNDSGEDSPPGKYHARGFAVAKTVSAKVVGNFFYNAATGETVPHESFTVEQGQPVADGRGKSIPEKVSVKLQPNPLEGDSRKIIEVTVGLDANSSFLGTVDGLPLRSLETKPAGAREAFNLIVKRALVIKSGDNALDVWVDWQQKVEQLRVSNVDKMMAFDAGEFELK